MSMQQNTKQKHVNDDETTKRNTFEPKQKKNNKQQCCDAPNAESDIQWQIQCLKQSTEQFTFGTMHVMLLCESS